MIKRMRHRFKIWRIRQIGYLHGRWGLLSRFLK